MMLINIISRAMVFFSSITVMRLSPVNTEQYRVSVALAAAARQALALRQD